MACFWWITAAALLTAPSVHAVSPTTIAEAVDYVWHFYRPTDRIPSMFSVATSISYNKKTETFVYPDVESDKVMDAFRDCEVYTGPGVVAATVLKYEYAVPLCPDKDVPWDHVKQKCGKVTWANLKKCPHFEALQKSYNWLADHAEYRVVKNFDKTFENADEESRKLDLMLFYVRANPCSGRCAGSGYYNILTDLKNIKEKWSNFAFAFMHLYIPNLQGANSNPEKDNRDSIKALGEAIGLQNVYRCLTLNRNWGCVRCHSDQAEDKIKEVCVKDV